MSLMAWMLRRPGFGSSSIALSTNSNTVSAIQLKRRKTCDKIQFIYTIDL